MAIFPISIMSEQDIRCLTDAELSIRLDVLYDLAKQEKYSAQLTSQQLTLAQDEQYRRLQSGTWDSSCSL